MFLSTTLHVLSRYPLKWEHREQGKPESAISGHLQVPNIKLYSPKPKPWVWARVKVASLWGPISIIQLQHQGWGAPTYTLRYLHILKYTISVIQQTHLFTRTAPLAIYLPSPI